jgi:flagella basal body P-ring formation protein FlgA
MTAIFLALATVAEAATVRVQPTAVAADAKVTVADVAVIEEAGEGLHERLAAIVVAYLPAGSTTREIRAESLREAIAAAGVNSSKVNLTGAVRCRVTVQGAASSGRGAFLTAIERYLRGAAPKARFSVADVEIDFEYKPDFVPVVTAVQPSAAVGPVRFDVADAADPSVKVGHLYAELSKSVPALVARRRMVGGHKVVGDDLEVAYVSAAEAPDFCSELSEVIGRRTLRTITAGEVLRAGCLENRTVIKRRDQVTFLVRTKSMTASVRTLALEDGAVGDVVRLRRLGQRREYLGRVIGPGKAEPLGGGRE